MLFHTSAVNMIALKDHVCYVHLGQPYYKLKYKSISVHQCNFSQLIVQKRNKNFFRTKFELIS